MNQSLIDVEHAGTGEHHVSLDGCAPTPLASYLKALGVLRIIAEQVDPHAKGCWRDESFIVVSRLDANELEAFFLGGYMPTPIVAPWGARSGFYPGSSESAARAALERIAASGLDRVAAFKDVIEEVHNLLERLGMTDKVRDEAKLELLRACRAELPDHLLPWLDACYVLTDEDRAFPPLLGTGGNEGSGSYVSGFAQQVVACLIERRHDHALAPALFGTVRPGTGSGQTPGQFAPLAAGGPNATTGFEGGSMLNPWDFLLCLEGTLLFAAVATKRLEVASGGALAFPFTVRAVGSGAGGVALADEANARAETWFPLWDTPASLRELQAILTEGRVQVSGRTARDALDFARSVASLGVQRGIVAFQRYAYVQRFGRNVIAVPIDRIRVQRNPAGDLIDEMDGWLGVFRDLARRREPAPPARLRSLVARIEDAVFDVTRSKHAVHVQELLIRLGEAQEYLARSPAARERVPSVPRLDTPWVETSDDGTFEFRLAAALAGLHGVAVAEGGTGRAVLPMATHFAPVDERRRWAEGSAHDVTWSSGSLRDNLCALAHRRVLAAQRVNVSDTCWQPALRAPLGAVAALLAGGIDEYRLGALLKGLVLARTPQKLSVLRTDVPFVLPAYAVLKPLFVPLAQLMRAERQIARIASDGEVEAWSPGTPHDDAARPASRDAATVVRLLTADRTAEAVQIGMRRLRARRMPAATSLAHTAHPRGQLLLSALLVPVSDAALVKVLRSILRRDTHSHTPDDTSDTGDISHAD
jgi:CRISPR-associated protein Csx17